MRALSLSWVWSIAAVVAVWTIRLDAAEPPAHRGLYGIWGDANLPYVVGGQVTRKAR